jgi:hypothetical protein
MEDSENVMVPKQVFEEMQQYCTLGGLRCTNNKNLEKAPDSLAQLHSNAVLYDKKLHELHWFTKLYESQAPFLQGFMKKLKRFLTLLGAGLLPVVHGKEELNRQDEKAKDFLEESLLLYALECDHNGIANEILLKQPAIFNYTCANS